MSVAERKNARNERFAVFAVTLYETVRGLRFPVKFRKKHEGDPPNRGGRLIFLSTAMTCFEKEYVALD